MLPAITATQIHHGLTDFLKTTFSISSHHFSGLVEEFVQNGEPFRGPYLSLGLPFAQGSRGREWFPELQLRFPPYLHQEQAFVRLEGEKPKSTLVATGTGSGKTECFLFPVLEHCRQNVHLPGIKAVLVYPMNALAADQARRIGEAIHLTPSLSGVRAGMYVGQREEHPKTVMGEDHVITDKEVLRREPPDILLTNYKMLDYLLIRHRDRKLWQYNEPDTLRFLVVDELHTFDGAQGTDLACLVRRLKARLRTPKGGLCCVGTSATLGSKEGADHLLTYARQIFGEPFDHDGVITEHRISPARFLGDGVISMAFPPPVDTLFEMDPDRYDTPEEYLAVQYRLWFGTPATPADMAGNPFRVRLGNKLKQHLIFQNLVREIKSEIRDFEQLSASMDHVFQNIPGADDRYRSLALVSLLSLISHARREIPFEENGVPKTGYQPLINVRLQFWLREMARMVVRVGNKPVLRYSANLPENGPEKYLPLVHCRECGAAGWLGRASVNMDHIKTELKPIYAEFFRKKGPKFAMFFPDTKQAREAEAQGITVHLCGSCGNIQPHAGRDGVCTSCHSENIVRVFLPESVSRNCPFCKAKNGMLLLGSRSASLTSAIISLLFSSRYNDDRKLITFSDNVQDAAHRAGFFGARTYGVTLRTAIQHCLQDQPDTPSLAEFPDQFRRYWKSRLSPEGYLATFIHPALEWRADYDRLKNSGSLPEGSALPGQIDKRLGWEIFAAYGLNARIGRTLEKTAASIAHTSPEHLGRAVSDLTEILANEFEDMRDLTPDRTRTFLTGLLTHIRLNGAIHHPVLKGYVEDWGKEYRLSQQHIHWMPSFGHGRKLPKLLTTRFGTHGFEQVFVPSKRTWCVSWLNKNVPRTEALGGLTARAVYDHVLPELVRCGILHEVELKAYGQTEKVWSLAPETLLLSTEVVRMRCSGCGHRMSVAACEADAWHGAPCHRFGCSGTFEPDTRGRDYYGTLYCRGAINRLFTAEHTGLLQRDEREGVEAAFKQSDTLRRPWDPNLLSCTPTLEMGIDIGDLSSTVQCSVPPSQANYLQRIGRAGRKDGNALNITIAAARPHDLYFFEEPDIMMSGEVEPPGVFLNASAVLERQLTGFCMDCWVDMGISDKDVPDKLGTVLNTLGKQTETRFPYNFLKFIDTRAEELLERFLAIFDGELSDAAETHLRIFIHGSGPDSPETRLESPLSFKILEGLGRIQKERKSLRDKAGRASEVLRRLEADPAGGEATKERITELRREMQGLRKLASHISQRNIFNFFTDEGLIPNYAFPEQGVTLHSIVYRLKDRPDDKGKYEVTTFEYERAAQAAITEFAPGNVFYAGKRKVCIDQVDIETSEVRPWRLCPDCAHSEPVGVEDRTGPCPACGSDLFGDAGQKRSMLRMSQVFATTADPRSRVTDDSESREPQFYVKQLLVDYKPEHVTEAWKLNTEETVFGYGFLSRAGFREINFGQWCDDEEGISVAGNDTPKKGFRICARCGKILYGSGRDNDHAWSCPSRKDGVAEKVLECVYLYRDFESEAIKVLLPFTGSAEFSGDMDSFIAAFNLGLKLRFGGSISHLRSTVLTEPDAENRTLRKQYLIIYDSVPGGTGYLKELMRDHRIFEVLAMALAHLRECPCNEKPELDGCYRCLLAYRNSARMHNISKKSAVRVLGELLRYRDTLVPTRELRSVSMGALFESELELLFIEALRRLNNETRRVRLGRQMVDGREGFFLEIGDARWEIAQQVELGRDQGVTVASRVDFLFRPARSGMKTKEIAVFTDGFTWHRDRVGLDTAQRMAIVRSGRYHVWSLTYHDVVADTRKERREVVDFILHDWSANKEAIWKAAELSNEMKMVGKSSMDLFVSYLTEPDMDQWKTAAETCALCSVQYPLNPKKREQTEAALRQRSPASLLAAGLLPGADYYGEHEDKGCRRSFSARRSPKSGSALLELADTEDCRETPEFETTWTGFLRAANLFQFLPHNAAVTESGLQNGLYDDLPDAPDLVGAGGNMPETDAAWDEVLEMVDDDFEELVRELIQAGVEVPEVGVEVMRGGEVVGEMELAWVERKIGVIGDEDGDGVREEVEKMGWRVFLGSEGENILNMLKRK